MSEINVYDSIGLTTLYPGVPPTFGLELNGGFRDGGNLRDD